MFPIFIDYLEVFVSDERFVVFASSSIVLALALFLFAPNSTGVARLLLCSAAFLLMFAFVVVAPLSAIDVVRGTKEMNPVALNFNFGFLALGLGLFLKFRRLPGREQISNSEEN